MCIRDSLKDRLGDVETDCRDRLHSWLLRIVGALTAPTSMALTCRWRSRPQHQKRSLDHLVVACEFRRQHLEAERPLTGVRFVMDRRQFLGVRAQYPLRTPR